MSLLPLGSTLLLPPTGLPVSSWMSGWTLDPHYPVINVDLVTRLGNVSLGGAISDGPSQEQQQGPGSGGVVVQLTQVPAMPGPVQCGSYDGEYSTNNTTSSVASGQWWIPVALSLPVRHTHSHLLPPYRRCNHNSRRSSILLSILLFPIPL